MAAKNQINVKAFDELTKQVSLVYDKLNALDAKLDGSLIKKFADLAKGVNNFSNAFINLKGVDAGDIVKSLEKIQKIFVEIDKFAQQIQQSSALEGTSLVRFANSLYRFMLAVYDSADLDTNIGNLAAVPVALNNFAKEFNKVNLNTRLENISETIKGFTKAFKPLSELKDITESINAIQFGENDALSKITRFFTGLISLSELSRDIKFSDSLTQIIKGVTEAIAAVANASVEDFTQNSKTLSLVVGELQAFLSSIQAFTASVHPATLLAARAYLGGINPIFTALAAVFTAASQSSFSRDKIAGLLQLFPVVGELLASFSNMIKTITKDSSIGLAGDIVRRFFVLGSILKPLNKLFEVFKYLPKTPKGSVGALKDVFNSVIELFGAFNDFILTISERYSGFFGALGGVLQRIFVIAPLFNQFTRVLTTINQSLALLRGIDPKSVSGLARIFKGFAESLRAFADFLLDLDAITAGMSLSSAIGKYIALRASLGQVVNVVGGIAKAVRGLQGAQIEGIGSLVRGLKPLFEGLTTFLQFISGAQFLDFDAKILLTKVLSRLVQIRLGLVPLGVILKQLRPVFKLSGSVDVGAVGAFTASLGPILSSLSQFLTLVSGQDFFRFNPLTLLPKLLSRLTQIAVGLTPIRAVINQLKPIFKSDLRVQGIQAFEKTLTTIMDFIEFASKFSTTAAANIDTGFYDTIQAIIKAFDFKGLKNFAKNAKGVDAFLKFADGLKSVFEAIQNLPKLDEASINFLKSLDLSAFQSLGKQLSKFVSGFDITPADIAKIDALAKLMTALPNLEELQQKTGGGFSGEEAGDSLKDISNNAKDVEDGILRAALKLAGFYAGFEALKFLVSNFNPVALFNDFVSVIGTGISKLRDMGQAVIDVASKIRDLGGSIREVGESFLNFGVGNITNSPFFTSAVEFDKLGNSLEVFGGLTKEQRAEAEAFANQIGKDYPLSANEALQATLDLVKAGQDLQSTEFILPAAADLAALSDSGSIENATAFIIQATSTFKEFSDTVEGGFENADTAVNIIAAAADSSTASVEGLAEGLANVGPVASQFGLSLEETTAALAIFTDNGIEGAEAGTQLKSFLTSLTTEAAQKELRRLGVSIEDDATGKIRPLNDILNDLQTAMYETKTVSYEVSKGLTSDQQNRLDIAQKALAAASRQEFLIGNDLNATGLGKNADKKLAEAQQIAANATAIITEITGSEVEAQRITREIQRTELTNAETLKKIAGSYGQSGLAILLAQGQDGLNGFVEQMNAVAPASERAKLALDNLAGDTIQLQGSVETLMTKALLPLLEKVFRPIVQVARLVVDSILSIDDSIISFIASATALGSIFLTIAGSLTVVTGALIQFGGAVLTAFAFFATSPLTLIAGFFGTLAGLATGIAALGAALVTVGPLLAGITFAFETLYKIFSENRGDAAAQFQNLAKNVSGALNDIATAIGQVLNFIGLAFAGTGTGALDSFGASLASFFNSISLQVTKFRTSGVGKTLLDIGQLFDGFAKALTFDAGAKKAADDAVAALDNVNQGFAGRASRESQKARDEYLKGYSEFLLGIANSNKLLQRILGSENLTAEDVQEYLSRAVEFVGQLRSGLGAVFGSFGTAFADAKKVLADGGGIGGALNTFVDSLGKNLDKSLGNLSSTILDAVGGLFNIDTKALSQVFDVKGFGAGVGELIKRGFAAAGKFLLSNRGTIKDLLTFAFEKLALGGLNLAQLVANVLGLENVSSALGSVIDTIKGIFGGIVDTIFNILQGQNISTALFNVFGPGILPVIKLVQSLGTAVDNIVGFIGQIFSAIFTPPAGASAAQQPFLLTLFNSLVTGITSFVDFLNNNVLSFLAAGDISGLIANFVSGISTTVVGLDIPGKFAAFANILFDGLKSAIKTAFVFTGGIFGFDGAAIFTQLDTALSTALRSIDPSSALGQVKAAFDELILAIQDLFGGADGLSIFDNIKTSVDNFVLAFSTLFAALSGPDAQAAKTDGPTLTSVIQGFIDLAGNLATVAIGTLSDFAKGLNDFTAAIAALSPEEIVRITIAISGFAIGLGVFQAGGITAAAAGGLNILRGAITSLSNTIVAKAGALLVIIQFFRAVAQNIDGFVTAFKDFANLDIAGAVSGLVEAFANTFVDLGFNLAEMLGIDELFGFTRDEFHKITSMIRTVMGEAAAQLSSQFSSIFDELINVTIPLLGSELERLRLSAKGVLGDEAANALVETFAAIDTVAGKSKSQAGEGETGFGFDFGDGGELLNNFLDTVEFAGGPATDRFKLQVARNFDTIFNQALVDYSANADSDPATRNALIDGMSRFFALSGSEGAAAGAALASGNTAFFNDLIGSMALNGATAADFGPDFQKQIADAISENFNALDLDSANASIAQIDLAINTLTSLGLDAAYLEEQKLLLQQRLDAVVDEALTPVETTVDVDATVGDTTVEGTDKVDSAVQDSVTGDGTPTVVNKNVAIRPNIVKLDQMGDSDILTPEKQLDAATQQAIPGFDTSALTNPDQVANFNSLVSELQQNVSTLATDLNGLTGTQLVVTTALTTMQTSITTFRDTTTPMFAAVKLAIDPITGALQSISGQLILLTIEFPAMAVSAVGSMLAIGAGVLALGATFTATLPAATQKVKDLAAALRDAAAAALALGGSSGISVTVSGVGGGGGVGAGRAEGGLVVPGLLYPFLEKNQPELLQIGNNTYLATPQTGMVTPLQSLTQSAATGLFSGPYNGAGTNSSQPPNQNIVVGDTNIDFSGMTAPQNVNPQSFAAMIADKVKQVVNDNNSELNRKLRSNQR